jgi:hypothetical protein
MDVCSGPVFAGRVTVALGAVACAAVVGVVAGEPHLVATTTTESAVRRVPLRVTDLLLDARIEATQIISTLSDQATLFYLNGDLLGAIAQAAPKRPHVRPPVLPRYHTREHHRSVAFRTWWSFNFNRAAFS